jgi:AcrR family transcriptional regulator
LPPKQKFTKEEIIAAALDIVRKDGITALTARELGAKLGTSSRPIFTAFRNMDEVKRGVILAAKSLYNDYTEEGLTEEIAFKGVGKQYFHFAQNEPKLFELLFMTADNAMTLTDILPSIDDNSEKILLSIQEPYGLSRENAYNLYQNMWVYTHGLACLCATGVSHLSEEEVSARLTDVFIGQLKKIKSEGKQNG